MLDTAGREAAEMADLFRVLVAAATLIWVLVLGTALFATRLSPGPVDPRIANVMVVGGGILLPTLALGGLLAWSSWTMAGLRDADGAGLHVDVAGEQWWWRVGYRTAGGERIVSANEIRLPAGETVSLSLDEPRRHPLLLDPSARRQDGHDPRPHEHARPRADEARNLSRPVRGILRHVARADGLLRRGDGARRLRGVARRAGRAGRERGLAPGGTLFMANGCGACHAVRGTEAQGSVGPDLTHVASRRTLGAGILPMSEAALADWIAHTRRIKPEARMPPYDMLPDTDISAIAG